MSTPGSAFADSFMRGFSLMDAYYARQKDQKRADRAETRAIESHDANMASSKIGLDNARLQNKKLKREDYARQYASIVSDDNGNPIDISKMTPDQLAVKKQQFAEFVNGYDPILKDLQAGNPDVVGLNNIEVMWDKKTNQPMIGGMLKMKDGTTKPLTWGRSSNAEDPVKFITLSELDTGIKSYLGQDMGMKPTMKEARQTKAASDAASLDHQRKKELAHIKAGTTPGSKNNKAITALKKNVYGLNNSNYGSAGLNGAFSFEGNKGHKRNMANVVADHMINSSQGDVDAGTISARAIQTVDQIYASGGEIKNVDGQWLMYTGQTDENGKPIVQPLHSDQQAEKPKSQQKQPANEQSQAPAKPKSGKSPTWDEYLAKAREVNPGVSDEDHRKYYDKTYRGGRLDPEKKTADQPKTKKDAGLADVEEKKAKPAAKKEPVKQDSGEELPVIGLESVSNNSNPRGRSARASNIKRQKQANAALQKVRSELKNDKSGAGLSSMANDDLAKALDSPHTTEAEKKVIRRYHQGTLEKVSRKITSMVS